MGRLALAHGQQRSVGKIGWQVLDLLDDFEGVRQIERGIESNLHVVDERPGRRNELGMPIGKYGRNLAHDEPVGNQPSLAPSVRARKARRLVVSISGPEQSYQWAGSNGDDGRGVGRG